MPPLEIYLATILVDPHRWVPPRQPAARASHWIDRAAAAGFVGVELWEFHWTKADAAERAALRSAALPIRVFNSYLSPAGAAPAAVAELAAAVTALAPGLRGVKFNLAGGAASLAGEIAAAQALAGCLPATARLYCECHPDTVAETPAGAAAAFAVWPESRFGAILHPFFGDDRTFAEWLQRLGPRVAHLHLQMRDEAFSLVRIVDRPRLAEARLRALLDTGFRGSLSLEFTAGVGIPPEHAESIWSHACRDLECVRNILERA